jgi:formamidopyrimidine-DNA glycosylase
VPELPDVTVYCESIEARVGGHALERIRLASPFVLRTYAPPASAFAGKQVKRVWRLGKRIVIECEEKLFVVIHLMIAGRFRGEEPNAKVPGKLGLAAFDFDVGTLILTEAATKKRASIHLFADEEQARALAAGGIELDGCTDAAFFQALTRENHTLKRALTDPRILSGVGNAYSDEILWDAKMSPVKMTSRLTPAEASHLLTTARDTLGRFTTLLRDAAKESFPEKVTAFRPEMAVHGKYGEPCRRCGSPVQRISYASNETNYCATCQTGGKLLADRALSRLLGADWPKSLEELEEMKASRVLAPGSPAEAPKRRRPKRPEKAPA